MVSVAAGKRKREEEENATGSDPESGPEAARGEVAVAGDIQETDDRIRLHMSRVEVAGPTGGVEEEVVVEDDPERFHHPRRQLSGM